MKYVDLRKVIPGFVVGPHIHFINIENAKLKNILHKNGFKVLEIEGKRIKNEKTFLDEFSKVLNFPEYFGHNWDAWNECLFDFGKELTEDKFALIWNEAETIMYSDPQILMEGLFDLKELGHRISSQAIAGEKFPRQFEVFLLGNWGKTE